MPVYWVGKLRVTNPFATSRTTLKVILDVRLACLIHAASVHPEPGSNSQKEGLEQLKNTHKNSFFILFSKCFFKQKEEISFPFSKLSSIFCLAYISFLIALFYFIFQKPFVKSQEPPRGLEPRTYGLQNRCSTN